MADARRRPLGFVVTEGQASDIAHAQAALEAVAVPRPRGPARTVDKGSAGGRPTGFDKPTYKIRNTVERCFSKLKQFRGFAPRYDKLSTRYQAGIQLVSTIIWLRTR
ncbi:transposase [Catenulispora sp. GP43]|uniref:hypothetical protein n=1 Tax=Catenulispora sp. GP43 TaxID=3156263 RepID=UPI003513AB5E